MEVLRKASGKNVKQLLFDCPACGCIHAAWIKNEPGRPQWSWNGDMEKPTFSPSLRVSSGPDAQEICHFYVKNGKIEYLSDCTHAMAGQTVTMKPFDQRDPDE